ncbi:MAG: VIT domain-containing protein, partial [Bacteroidota bacterium]
MKRRKWGVGWAVLLPIVMMAATLLSLNSEVRAGGMLLAWPHGAPKSHPSPLTHKSSQISVQIEDQFATTEVRQVFENPTGRRLEGYFILPVAPHSVIRNFSMEINGYETQAELLDAKKARGIYEEIVRKLKDPALLEYHNRKLFKVRIFPIEPGKEQRIRIVYAEELPRNNGTVEYRYPLKVKDHPDKAAEQLSFKIAVKSQTPIRNLYCPTHEVEIIRHGNRAATVGFEGKPEADAGDLRLYCNTDPSKLGLSLLNYQEGKEDGYFQLSLSPGFIAKPREV